MKLNSNQKKYCFNSPRPLFQLTSALGELKRNDLLRSSRIFASELTLPRFLYQSSESARNELSIDTNLARFAFLEFCI